MDGIGGQMKTFCKFTAQSSAASYVPLPRFLLQDEALRGISNDAKVLYALLLDRASISRQNGYIEPDGTIRLYFTLEQAQTKLHRSLSAISVISDASENRRLNFSASKNLCGRTTGNLRI